MDFIEQNMVGTWEHVSTEGMEQFLSKIGASPLATSIMLSSTPRLTFEVKGSEVVSTNVPTPSTDPDILITYTFKLDQEFELNLNGLEVQMTVTCSDGKMTQLVRSQRLHSHRIEFSRHEKQLVQAFCYTDDDGVETKATLKYKRTK
ncbi:uncharacterized protein LOC127846445 [Dreissena polymorpha]|uniref:uncharacterized protein LOC127846445 n=1 Tax=Dreissena polymorpha TaxID=45954 RepID=UPI002264478E|nr:uncharacterized protein LOC127846445 [Dreissena polymorpha]